MAGQVGGVEPVENGEEFYCVFICHKCNNKFKMEDPNEDPTSSSGCCKLCGSNNWDIAKVNKTTGRLIEYLV